MLHDLSPEVTDYLLSSQLYGRLCCAADGQVLVLPVTYLYDGQAIYGQIREGTKTRLMRKNPTVCFEVDELRSPSCWQSVVVQGVYEELQGDERLNAEQQLGPGRVAPLKLVAADDTDVTAPEPMVVYRIRIVSKTGRSETVELPDIHPAYQS
ncbi:pyridoxamine 5'-phosphate oxidase family protein [Spirosoma arcticum]